MQYTNPHHPAGQLYPRPHTAGGPGRRSPVPGFDGQGGMLLDATERAVIALLSQAIDGLTSSQLRVALDLSRSGVAHVVERLHEDRLIRIAGGNKGHGHLWMIA